MYLRAVVAEGNDCPGNYDPDGPGDPNDPDPAKRAKRLLWIDYFSDTRDEKRGVLFGLFNGSPIGCHVVGVKVPLQDIPYHITDSRNRFYGLTIQSFTINDLTYGYHIVKDKPTFLISDNQLDLSKLPVPFSQPEFNNYAAYAQWINPQCYWAGSPTTPKGGFFGGIFDIFRNLFFRS